ncbi:hypothetical protein EDB85DRAFT_1900097 [Lactarius pseudohatsudake]|nr:hypothetical protein EDB85DRAFT_1900097 [Lactarius pseudohatsudake]
MCHIRLPSLTQNRRHFLLDRIGEMLGHVRCPQPDHDHDYPTTTTATQLQVVCTANRDHADDNDNDRNDAAPSKHADDEERGSTTGDDCANNDCHLKTVSTSRGTLPTRWSYYRYSAHFSSSELPATPKMRMTTTTAVAGSPHATAASPPPRVHPAQLRSSTAIYALSGLLKYHTAALAFDNTCEKRQTRRPMRAPRAPQLARGASGRPRLGGHHVRAVRNHDDDYDDDDDGSGRQPRVTGTTHGSMTVISAMTAPMTTATRRRRQRSGAPSNTLNYVSVVQLLRQFSELT